MTQKNRFDVNNASTIPSDVIIERYNHALRMNGNDKVGAIDCVIAMFESENYHEDEYHLIRYRVLEIINRTK